ncbi:LysE family translocator [Enterovibrio norvegicus]|uniref:Lysine transporter LysE n=1 Tax=Enterovibrio norvegicus TaxID=188144 RepID=A0A2N7LAK5_9GAMM|nr:LysE family translocator [Enterovibrio norvegicus]PMN91605.1 lysine transporter LysE [Enterovibrio norvegicus]
MDLLSLLLFVPACFALNMTPGPNNLLAMNNARCYGFLSAMLASVGRLVAFSVMIALAASGLAVILYASETVFFAIKVFGALYLFWIAFQLWRSTALPILEGKPQKSVRALLQQEFALAAGNPKAILIFTAFLPQFVDVAGSVNHQFFVLGATFLALEFLAIAVYALFGLYLRHWFSNPKMATWFNRGCATVLSISGGNLLLMDRQS